MLLRKDLQILTTDCRIFRQKVYKTSSPAQSEGRSDNFLYQYGTPKHAWPHPTDLYHILTCLGISGIWPLSTANSILSTIRYFSVLGGKKVKAVHRTVCWLAMPALCYIWPEKWRYLWPTYVWRVVRPEKGLFLWPSNTIKRELHQKSKTTMILRWAESRMPLGAGRAQRGRG